MAKKDDNNMLLIGGIAIAAFFLLNKKKSAPANTSLMYRPTNSSYAQTSTPGAIVQSAGSAIADIINAIKNKKADPVQQVIAPPVSTDTGYDYPSYDDSGDTQYYYGNSNRPDPVENIIDGYDYLSYAY